MQQGRLLTLQGHLPANHGAGMFGCLYQSWVLCSFATHELELTLNLFRECYMRAGYTEMAPGFPVEYFHIPAKRSSPLFEPMGAKALPERRFSR